MKRSILFLLVLPMLVFSQDEKTNPESLAYKEFRLNTSMKADSTVKLPFSRIQIIDSRSDTSKFGFMISEDFIKGKKNAFKKLSFQGGISQAIEKFYNKYYETAFEKNGFELLIVMKKFWLSGIAEGKNNSLSIENNTSTVSNFYIKWEYYLGKDSNYLPIKRIDTVFDYSDRLNGFLGSELSSERMALTEAMLKDRIEKLNYDRAVTSFDSQPKKTMAFIKKYNEERFRLPVLVDSGFKNGVYITFDEFKKNNPSIINFKEKRMKYSLTKKAEKYIEGPAGENIDTYWGYYEGENFRYGELGNDKLYRIGNTFQVFIRVNWASYDKGSTRDALKPKINIPLPGHPSLFTATSDVIWFPYQVDMETGRLY